MNPVVLYFADGTIFFAGLAVVVVAAMLLRVSGNRMMQGASIVLGIFGIILVLISATPLPVLAYLLWTLVMVIGFAVLSWRERLARFRPVAAVAIFVSSAGLFLVEVRYHRPPEFVVPEGATVYVIGDSISAGMGTEHDPWPAVLDRRSSWKIVNLAMAGATVESALDQADRIVEDGSYVIVEIGGNDLLGNTDAMEFAVKLDRLILSLNEGGHRILLLELPLFPFQNGYGKAQREIAAKYGAILVPKRYFTKVLGMKDGTLDGLHLSQEGHDAMAEMITQILAK